MKKDKTKDQKKNPTKAGELKKETLVIHGVNNTTHSLGAIALPIYQTSTYVHPEGKSTGYDYSRVTNPTRDFVEKLVCELEDGDWGLAFSSGMAAISVAMELFKPGDEIIASDDLYGGSIRLLRNISEKNGYIIHFVDTSDLEAVKKTINSKTKGILIETPTNPTMKVTDIAATKKLLQEKGAKDAILIVDNTFLSPYFSNPLHHGADLVVHSGTKFLSGHDDSMSGFLITGNDKLTQELKTLQKTIGSGLSPFDSFLISRGIKTLALRMQRQEENAIKIANFLKNHPKIEAVYYPGLPDHPGYEISKKQSSGFGSMISFRVNDKKLVDRFLSKPKLILFAESLGGVQTLITYPVTQTHAEVPHEEREARGINDRFLRLSVGIENVEDILDDLKYILDEVN